MDLLLWLAGAATMLLVLVLPVGRRQRRNRTGAPHGPSSPAAPAHGSPTSNAWTFGGGAP